MEKLCFRFVLALILMRKRPRNAEGARQAREFFRWVYANGDAQARALDYVPLPDSLVQRIESYWRQQQIGN